MTDIAVKVDSVTKWFKKNPLKTRVLTLKSLFTQDIWNRDKNQWLKALEDISFEAPRGTTFGVIGSNGSGKSTLLRIIAGLIKPTRGSVAVDGKLSALIELGAGFHPEISGRENVFINGIMLGLSKAEIKEKYDEIIRFSELEDFIDNPVKTYSSGMALRLGFSIAVHINPDVLLVDEVIAVGDEAFIHKCIDKIFEFKRKKKTIILVSHNLGSVEKLCDDAVLLSGGKITASGRPREVIDQYLMWVAEKEKILYASHHDAMQKAIDEGCLELDEQENHVPENTEKAAACGDIGVSSVHKKRWGSKEIKINKVKIYNENNTETYLFQSGEKVRIEIHFEAEKKVKEPVFGIGLFTVNDIWVFGTNTAIEKYKIEHLCGKGKVSISFSSLNLVEGTYFLDVAVHHKKGQPFDYLSRMYHLGIRSRIKDYGIFRPEHDWRFEGDIKMNNREQTSRGA